MKKGDIVKIKAIIRSVRKYGGDGIVKEIRKYKSIGIDLTGIVLGYSFIKTGKIIKSRYYDEPNHLEVIESHRVVVVEPFESSAPYSSQGPKLIKNNRYLEPVRCFEEDLEQL